MTAALTKLLSDLVKGERCLTPCAIFQGQGRSGLFGLLDGIGNIFARILELTVVPAIGVLLRPPFIRAG
jgi:hypothetical protein